MSARNPSNKSKTTAAPNSTLMEPKKAGPGDKFLNPNNTPFYRSKTRPGAKSNSERIDNYNNNSSTVINIPPSPSISKTTGNTGVTSNTKSGNPKTKNTGMLAPSGPTAVKASHSSPAIDAKTKGGQEGGGGSGYKPPGGLQSTQKQVDEVVGIMRDNVEKILERDSKLTELDSRCDTLKETSSAFQTTTKKIKQKFWWQDKIYLIALVGLVVLIILSVIIGLVVHFT